MLRPICFALMPFGTKSTSTSEGSRAPDSVNFDRLWAAAFRPAIDRAGYEPVRFHCSPYDVGAYFGFILRVALQKHRRTCHIAAAQRIHLSPYVR